MEREITFQNGYRYTVHLLWAGAGYPANLKAGYRTSVQIFGFYTYRIFLVNCQINTSI
jgi:hypothetical protein